jgi:hypothetical protein
VDSNAHLFQRYEALAANVTEGAAWLGWLRAGEFFNVCREDLDVIQPDDSDLYDLPRGTGSFLVNLLPSTKSSKTKHAYLIFAYETASGIQFGAQVQELFDIMDQLGWHDGHLFRHPTGIDWTNAYYRNTHLLSLLEMQAAAGGCIWRQKVRIG